MILLKEVLIVKILYSKIQEQNTLKSAEVITILNLVQIMLQKAREITEGEIPIANNNIEVQKMVTKEITVVNHYN